MNLVQTLQGVGFTLYESKAISACLEFGEEATAVEIASRAGIPVTKVYSVLKALENRGILSSGFERPKRYSCISMAELKRMLVEEKRREQEKILSVLDHHARERHACKGPTSVFWGKGELKKRLCEGIASAENVSVIFSEEESVREAVKPNVLRILGKKARKNGRVRVLFPSESLENAGAEALALLAHANTRAMVSAAPSMMVTDGLVIVGLQDLEGNIVGGIETRDPPLVAELRGYYELLWEQSSPQDITGLLNERRARIMTA